MMNQKSLDLLRELSEADGVPGHEGEIRTLFMKHLINIGDIFCDPMGNISCTKHGSTELPNIMIDSHIDEVGFMVQSITSDGFIKFVPLGGWWTHTLPGQRVKVMTDTKKIPGVIGATPPHFLSQEKKDKLLKIEELHIDVGAADREQAYNFGISPGCAIVPDSPFLQFKNEKILSAKALDNRVGTALVIETLQQLTDHPNTVYGVGSVQEEVGVRGATTSVRGVNPDIAFVLEGAPADDIPGLDKNSAQGKLGSGVQIRLFDPTMIANPKLARWVIEIAREHTIPYQTAVRRSGGTDARAIHLHYQGIPTIVIGVPARYIHSHVSLIHRDDYDAALKLLITMLPLLNNSLVNSFKNR